MKRARAFVIRRVARDSQEILRIAITSACAVALIAAGQSFPL
ncbi:hypothetical protein OZN62_08930 [Aurantiacibacter sp. MUD11]|nr:hypothetical protein [Aurantiacibacter sp. MUD11]WAT17061.1 hypothetical protein OZN62_08930 [Aurantiacibacter sp. MUD11]